MAQNLTLVSILTTKSFLTKNKLKRTKEVTFGQNFDHFFWPKIWSKILAKIFHFDLNEIFGQKGHRRLTF